MLLYTALGSGGKRLSHHQTSLDSHKAHITLAISLQLLPVSRICFSRCSSAAVHGVFVLPVRFLPLSSLSREGIETFELCSGGRGRVVPGGSVSSLGLFEARRFRGLAGGDLGGGTNDTCVLGGGAVLRTIGSAAAGTSAVVVGGEAFDFWRLCGGDLKEVVRVTCAVEVKPHSWSRAEDCRMAGTYDMMETYG